MNIVAICVSWLCPWTLFTVIYGAMCSDVHHNAPWLIYFIEFGGLFVVIIAVLIAVRAKYNQYRFSTHDPTWLIFVAATMIIAWALAVVLGNANYSAHMKQYYNLKSLMHYHDVYPSVTSGQQVMDAGTITFAAGARLALEKSMGFKSGDVYCVVPVVLGGASLGPGNITSYDFWAVGKNCCSGNQPDFHCKGFNNPRSNGGIRLMSDSDRAFYRLAVQQAEATYRIKANHPLFFTWTRNPSITIEGLRAGVFRDFLVYMFAHFLFQGFLVMVATLAFSKIGHFP